MKPLSTWSNFPLGLIGLKSFVWKTTFFLLSLRQRSTNFLWNVLEKKNYLKMNKTNNSIERSVSYFISISILLIRYMYIWINFNTRIPKLPGCSQQILAHCRYNIQFLIMTESVERVRIKTEQIMNFGQFTIKQN